MLLTKKLDAVRQLLDANRRLFLRQGAVIATYREAGGRRLGPYYSLRYRDGSRQRSCYLGRCAELAAKVREMLARLQAPRRSQLQLNRIRRLAEASLRRHMVQWRADFEEFNRRHGGHLRLKGREVRGWRRLYAEFLPRRSEPTAVADDGATRPRGWTNGPAGQRNATP